MTDLLTLAREHDLPPKWDGLVVHWRGWEEEPFVFICPPPADFGACPQCGSISLQKVNVGAVARLPEITLEQIEAREAQRDALPAAVKGKLAPLALRRLYASRCGDCLHDVVTDMDTLETWDLEPSDYGDDGSPSADASEPPPPEPAPKASSGKANALAKMRAEIAAAQAEKLF